MKQNILIFLFFILSPVISNSQILKGKITTQSGDPVQYATVYIQELKQGTTANTKGDYELRLPSGKYTVTYQSLGFQPVFFNLILSNNTVTKNVVLPVQYYEIPEVRISATGEDPAYAVMRKAIGMAPYYLNNISYYKAEVYLKGDLLIKRIPKLLQKSMKMESHGNSTSVSGGGKPSNDQVVMKAGDAFFMESYNEMEFTAPDKYVQKVISYNSTFPEQGNEISPMSFIEASFYQPVIADIAISPLSPAAFSHYRFKYLGASPQGNFIINKIQVIPKRKSQQLFEGTIYIIEDLWCLQSVDLNNENLVGKISIQQLYIPVQNDIWLPVSHKFEINIGIVGFKADAGYGSSVKYLEVKPNLALQKPGAISVEAVKKPLTEVKKPDSIPATKAKKQIDKILAKEELSNRDMVKLANLMEKESRNSINDSSNKKLEIKDHTTHIIDKDASKKDSTYWAEIRPIPLSDIELRSLRISDSTKASQLSRKSENDTIKKAPKKEEKKFFKGVKAIVNGHTWRDTSGNYFGFGGLIDLKKLSFNPVDGFIYGVDFNAGKSWKKNKSLYISPEFLWAFSREQLICRVNSYYKFNGLNPGNIYLRAGITSHDINNGTGINTLLNTESALLFKMSYLKLYESKYLTLGFIREITNGLTIEIRSTYEHRNVLQNTTNFSLIKYSKPYSVNEPVNVYLGPGSNPVNALNNQTHGDLITKISYTPFQRYRLNHGNKIPAGSDWPTLSLTWQHGLNKPDVANSRITQFDMLRFEAFRRREIGAFGEFKWRIRTGGFIDNRNLSFYDFFHFNSQPIIYLINNYEDAFMLPAYYSMSTPEFFGEVHIKYTTPYLLIKLLPVISNTLMRENLSLSYLGSRYHSNYTELGYSISEIFFIAELGVYVGFEDLKYKSIGGKLIFKFD
jgi:hypothetical protein